MSVEENKAIVTRMADEIWNKGNIDILDELMDADYVGLPYPEACRRERQKEGLRRMRENFDVSITLHDVVAEGDKVVMRLTQHFLQTKVLKRCGVI